MMYISNSTYSARGATKGAGGRGVQYVHCVMHKCIMVKVGHQKNVGHQKKGKRNTCECSEIRGENLQK